MKKIKEIFEDVLKTESTMTDKEKEQIGKDWLAKRGLKVCRSCDRFYTKEQMEFSISQMCNCGTYYKYD